MNNNATPKNGTRGVFTHPHLPKMGTMTGHVEFDPFCGETLFMPDEKYHERLDNLYTIEGEAGLFFEEGTFSPT